MNPESPVRAGLHPSIVLSAYLEPLVRGRRVAILGDATIGLADELSQRGARLLHVYDPEAARVAEALARAAPGRPHQVSYAVLAGDLGVRDGAFDAVIVPDLSLFADPADAIRRARRLVPANGVAVFVTPNAGAASSAGSTVGGARPGLRRLLRAHAPQTPAASTEGGHEGRTPAPLGYYELFDLVSLQFGKVRMVGQAPFVGYTIADFAPDGEPEISVDTSLLASSEEPEHFLAIASERPVALDAYAVIELPWADVVEAAPVDQAVLTTRVVEKRALADAEARVAAQGAELGALRAREGQLTEAARGTEQRAAARNAELEAEAEVRGVRLRELEARAGDNHVRAERLANQIRDLEEELVRQRDRATKLSKLLDDEKRARTKAELELGIVRGKPEIPGAKERLDALAADLDAARARIADLERDLAEARRPVPPPLPPPPDVKLIHRLNELEQAVNAALHEAAEAAGQRDAALDRAGKAEALLTRAAVVEAQLAAEQRDRAGVDERAGVAEKRAAEASRRLADAERRLADAERETARRAADAERRLADAERETTRRTAETERRAAETERRLAEGERRVTDAERRLAEAAPLVAERDARLVEQAGRLAALEAELAAERRRADEAQSDESAAEAAAAEIASLESALRARGHAVAAVTRDLRESERVGKELLGELEGLRAWNGEAEPAPPTPGAAPIPSAPSAASASRADADLRARLDALAASAARSQADLQAASWRISQLERELAEARRGAGEPTSVQIELEQALAAARDEVAALRRALGDAAS